MKLHEKLKWARKKTGYNFRQISQRTGIKYSQLLRFERGKAKPSFIELLRLGRLYRTTIAFFLSEDEPEEETMLWCK